MARLFGEVHDVFGVGIARPRDVGLTLGEGLADRVNTGHEIAIGTEHVEYRRTHASHDLHVDHDVGRVGDLDADLGDVGAERAHAEWNHVHGPAPHATVKQLVECRLHLLGVGPVIGRTGVDCGLAADEGPILDSGDIARVAPGQEAAWAGRLVEADEGSGLDHRIAQRVVLLVGSITPMHAVGLAQVFDLCDPREERSMGGGRSNGCHAQNRMTRPPVGAGHEVLIFALSLVDKHVCDRSLTGTLPQCTVAWWM